MMYEIFRQFVYLVINPLVVLPGLLLLASVLHKKSKFRFRNRVLVGALVYFFISSTGFLPDYLISQQEAYAPPMLVPPQELIEADTVYVIVLGSGASAQSQYPPNLRLYSPTLSRLVEGVRIVQQLPGGQLITSGYDDKKKVSQAYLVAQTAQILGVPDSLMHMLETPTTTQEEAQACAATISNRHPLVVVTSANHLRRATIYFEKEGFNVYPAPAEFRSKSDQSFWERCTPQWYHIRNFMTVQKEWIGLVQAKLR